MKSNTKKLMFIISFWLITGSISVIIATNPQVKNVHINLSEDGDKYSPANFYHHLSRISEVLGDLNDNYVEEIDYQKLVDSAISGMLKELDPHTNFFHPSELKNFRDDTRGEFSGLGISISRQDDFVTVVAPIEGSPAYRLGILAGDRIVKVDGENIIGIPTRDAIKMMRGEEGTKVLVTIERPGIKELLDFEIIREIIEIHPVPYIFNLENDIGYLRIRQFSAKTTSELSAALNELEEGGMQKLIIDLRFNPGGLLSEAVNTLDEFLGSNELVVYTKGKSTRVNKKYYTETKFRRKQYPIIVLINEASASASEIFAGTIQDYDLGIVLGETSFGKGSVQQVFPLTDDYGIKITIAKYYINSGRCIHKDINDKILQGEEFSDEEKEVFEEEAHKEIFYTKNQRKVFGGGGITPDIEIKQKPLTSFEIELFRKNLPFKYSIDYLLAHKGEINLDWKADDKMMEEFLEFAKNDSIEFTQTDVDSVYSEIKSNLTKNIIARKFNEVAGYKVGMKNDIQIQEAIRILNKFDTLDEMFEYAKNKKEEENE